jgi:hypothetical protein
MAVEGHERALLLLAHLPPHTHKARVTRKARKARVRLSTQADRKEWRNLQAAARQDTEWHQWPLWTTRILSLGAALISEDSFDQ